MSPDPHPWAADLTTLHQQIWTLLLRAVHDRRAAARHPTLATVSPDGRPQARTVVLRAADRPSGCLDLHTDLRSAKIADLTHTPFALLHIWDSSAHLQMRLAAEVTVLTGAAVAPLWARVPEGSRVAYGSDPAPGQPLPDALAYDRRADPAAFAVLRLHLTEIDALHLGPQHRRARFDRADGWLGQWLAP